MDQGNFNASTLFDQGKDSKSSSDVVKDVYTKGGLRAILGVEQDGDVEGDKTPDEDEEEKDSARIESAMASLEDADDVAALRGAQKEAADELKEFDESIEYAKESDAEDDSGAETKKENTSAKSDETEKQSAEDESKKEEQEMEKEFAAWQEKAGMDASAIEASLSPMERYGLRFRTEIDPFYSIFAVMEEQRKNEAQHEADDAMDIDEIERENEEDELRAMENGDLLATFPEPEDLVRQKSLYLREKARLRASKKLRKLTGQDWESRVDGLTKNPLTRDSQS